MIHIALFLLFSSCCITPMHASPNRYAVLLEQEDTFDSSASQDQDENALEILAHSFIVRREGARLMKTRLGNCGITIPWRAALAQRNNAELNQLLAPLLKDNNALTYTLEWIRQEPQANNNDVQDDNQ